MKDKMIDEWLGIKEVCKYTGLASSTIHRLTSSGSLRVSRKTGKNLFRRSWIDSFLEG